MKTNFKLSQDNDCEIHDEKIFIPKNENLSKEKLKQLEEHAEFAYTYAKKLFERGLFGKSMEQFYYANHIYELILHKFHLSKIDVNESETHDILKEIGRKHYFIKGEIYNRKNMIEIFLRQLDS